MARSSSTSGAPRAGLAGLLTSLLLVACGGSGGGPGAQPAAPSALRYAHDPAILAKSVPAPDIAPSVKGAVSSWSVVPALPDGLTFDPKSGVIRGTPADVAAPATYTVTAKNAHGAASTQLELSVVLPASFAVSASLYDDTLSVHVLDPTTGRLRPSSFVPAAPGASGATQVVPFPGGSPLYVVHRDSDQVGIYDLDLATGRLQARPPVATGPLPFNLVLHPSGQAAYVTLLGGGLVQAYAVDPLTRDLTPLGAAQPTGAGPEGLAIEPGGRFLYVGNSSSRTLRTFAVDPQTLELTQVGGDLPTGKAPISMAISADARFLYLVNARSESLTTFALDAQSGLPTFVEERLVGLLPASVVIEPTQRFLYVAISGQNALLAFERDGATGELTQVGPAVAVGVQPNVLRVDDAGRHLYAANTSGGDLTQLTIDPESGRPSVVTSSTTREQPLGFALVTGDQPPAPSPEFAYVANRGSGSLSMFSADGQSGFLTQVGLPLSTGLNPRALAIDPWSRFVYMVDGASQSLFGFAIDPLSGALSEVGAPLFAGADPRALVVDRSGRFVIVAAYGEDALYTFALDPQSGALSAAAVVPAGSLPVDLVVEPTGRFLYVANQGGDSLSAFRIEPQTGALTPLGPDLPAGSLPRSLEPHPSGRHLYATFQGTGRLGVYPIDPASGLLGAGASVKSGTHPSSIAVDPLGRYAFTTNLEPAGTGDLSIFELDAVTAQPLASGLQLAGLNPIDAKLDPSGAFLYVVNQGSDDVSLFAVDAASGSLSPLGSYPVGVSPDAIVIAGTLAD